MKIALINPGLLEIPPKGWGAMEKYIYNYKYHLEKFGHLVDLKFSNDPLHSYDIVLVFVYNQALNLYKRNIPYIFSYDDVHPLLFGKDSDLYKENLLAMQYSLLTIVHGKFVMNEFPYSNMVYLPHGVDTKKYVSINKQIEQHNLLCVANDIPVGRKGFHLAIQAAKNLNLPITVAGPNKNKNFFDTYSQLTEYDKLTILDNLMEEDLIRIMNEHTIFVHPSSFETGVPNLTIVESLSCGLPVVGTFNSNEELPGLIKIELSVESVENGIKRCIENYNSYKKDAIETSKKYDWELIVRKLENIFFKIKKNYYSDFGND